MENTSYVALSAQVALGQQMNIIANNIANLNTTAFKEQSLIVTEYPLGEDIPGNDTPIRSVLDYGLHSNFTQGPLSQTGNQFDFALQGNGFFVVEHRDTGLEYYTRAGNFVLNSNNEIVTAEGHKLLGNAGPIVVPAEAERIEVSRTGTISSPIQEIGQFRILEFENQQNLEEFGGGLFQIRNNDEGTPATGTEVLQGMLEESNVNAIAEISQMIDVSRRYQSNQRLLQSEHERIRNAIRSLGDLT